MDGFNNQVNDTTESTVDYSQPGAFAGETAEWQANNAQEELPTYTETFAGDVPVFEETAAPEEKKLIGLSIASMVLGILSILCCLVWYVGGFFAIVGLILGIVAKTKKCAGKGMALAGIICSVLGLLIAAVTLVVVIIGVVTNAAATASYYYY